MKIEFVKETKLNGRVLYSTEIDGDYVTDSAHHDYDKAHEFYLQVVINCGNKISKEIIKTTEL